MAYNILLCNPIFASPSTSILGKAVSYCYYPNIPSCLAASSPSGSEWYQARKKEKTWRENTIEGTKFIWSFQ